jgi:hypothetical protein
MAWRRGAAAAGGGAALRRVGKGARCCISLEDGGTRVRPTVSGGGGPREPQRRRRVTIIVPCRSTTCSSPFGAWSPCPIVIPAAQLLDVGPQPIAHRRRRVRPQRPSALQGLGRGWAPRRPSSRLLGRWWPSLLTVLRSGEAVVLLRSAMAFVYMRSSSFCLFLHNIFSCLDFDPFFLWRLFRDILLVEASVLLLSVLPFLSSFASIYFLISILFIAPMILYM